MREYKRIKLPINIRDNKYLVFRKIPYNEINELGGYITKAYICFTEGDGKC